MNLKAKSLVNSSVYRSRNKRNGGHQTLLFGAESIHTFPETVERPRKVQALDSGLFTENSLRRKTLTKIRTFELFTGPEEKVPQSSFQTCSKQISHRYKQDERLLQRERPQNRERSR